jgi:hypothetical protein
MNKSALKISLAITLIVAFSFSVTFAGVKNCTCLDSLYGQSKSSAPPSTCTMAGGCRHDSPPPPPSDKPCPCQDNACAFLMEKKKADFILAQWDGSQVVKLNGVRTEKILLTEDLGGGLIPGHRPDFLYLNHQNLRC